MTIVKISDIDLSFDFRTDSYGKDPDSASPTLRAYHQALWSKPLPNGQVMHLTTDGYSYLRWGDMYFGSDSITASFRYNKKLLDQVAQTLPSISDYIEDFLHKAYTIGGTIIFPKHRWSMNQARGMSRKICDRWDLTLECIYRYYKWEPSPLDSVMQKDKEFFDAFVDFKGYVDFFLLQDCVDENYRVKLWLDTPLFESNSIPQNAEEYCRWINAQLDFVKRRAKRIENYCKTCIQSEK